MFGFLAQEVEKYFPEIVRRDADGWRRIQGGAFEPLLIEGLRFHDRRIAQLEEENRELNRRLVQLEEDHTALRREVAAEKELDVARDAQISRLLEISRVLSRLDHEGADRREVRLGGFDRVLRTVRFDSACGRGTRAGAGD